MPSNIQCVGETLYTESDNDIVINSNHDTVSYLFKKEMADSLAGQSGWHSKCVIYKG